MIAQLLPCFMRFILLHILTIYPLLLSCAQNLRDTLDSMYDARVPKLWQKISWDSSTIGFWYTELLDRDTQFRSWVFGGRPNVFWMTGFFNPNGFLTAMRQVRVLEWWRRKPMVLQFTCSCNKYQVSVFLGIYYKPVKCLVLIGIGWQELIICNIETIIHTATQGVCFSETAL